MDQDREPEPKFAQKREMFERLAKPQQPNPSKTAPSVSPSRRSPGGEYANIPKDFVAQPPSNYANIPLGLADANRAVQAIPSGDVLKNAPEPPPKYGYDKQGNIQRDPAVYGELPRFGANTKGAQELQPKYGYDKQGRIQRDPAVYRELPQFGAKTDGAQEAQPKYGYDKHGNIQRDPAVYGELPQFAKLGQANAKPSLRSQPAARAKTADVGEEAEFNRSTKTHAQSAPANLGNTLGTGSQRKHD
jgi:hypothetical protein